MKTKSNITFALLSFLLLLNCNNSSAQNDSTFTFDKPERPEIKMVGYKYENIINGWTRLAENSKSLWVSDPSESFPQWIELDFDKSSEINTVHLTFDTDLSTGRPEKDRQEVCVKSYDVSVLSNGKWVKVAECNDNFQRHRIHKFQKVRANKLRVDVNATHGTPSARIFEVRGYNE